MRLSKLVYYFFNSQTSGLVGNVTLGALTLNATATVSISASADITLGALTSTAAAALALKASAGVTLGALTLSATATVTTPADPYGHPERPAGVDVFVSGMAAGIDVFVSEMAAGIDDVL